MRPPAFWQNPPDAPGWQAHALAPLSAIYAMATARRVRKAPRFSPDIPVISVGNLNVGGTGKTPTVIALVEMLSGHPVHIVSRGYGGDAPGPLRVDASKHTAKHVGDEPLMLAAFAPTWIAPDRAAGVALAEDAGARIVILDDGHQNPSVPKALNIVVVDAERGFGNGRVLPGGPLREPVPKGLARADLILSIGNAQAQSRFSKIWGSSITVPRLTGQLELLETGMDWKGQNVLAFAGIGHPEKFFQTVRETGANLVRAEPLDDHQPLSEALLSRLEVEAFALDAQLVTTEKDAARLPQTFRRSVLAMPVRLRINERADLEDRLSLLLA